MKEIKQEQLKKFSKAFASYPQNKVMQNVLAKNDLTSSIRINERKVFYTYNHYNDLCLNEKYQLQSFFDEV